MDAGGCLYVSPDWVDDDLDWQEEEDGERAGWPESWET